MKPVARCGARAEVEMAAMYAAKSRARWLVASAGWWPRPRRVEDGEHNAEWRTYRCPECREWKGTLVTTRAVARGEEMTVREEENIIGGGDGEWPIEMTFVGGAREVNGRRVAGAGAIVWVATERVGGRAMAARAVIGLPGEAHAQVAEACGCRVGLQMVMDTQSRLRAARVAGGNL